MMMTHRTNDTPAPTAPPAVECPVCSVPMSPTPLAAHFVCLECGAECYLPSRGKPAAEGRRDLEVSQQDARICLGERRTTGHPGRRPAAVVRSTSSFYQNGKSRLQKGTREPTS